MGMMRDVIKVGSRRFARCFPVKRSLDAAEPMKEGWKDWWNSPRNSAISLEEKGAADKWSIEWVIALRIPVLPSGMRAIRDSQRAPRDQVERSWKDEKLTHFYRKHFLFQRTKMPPVVCSNALFSSFGYRLGMERDIVVTLKGARRGKQFAHAPTIPPLWPWEVGSRKREREIGGWRNGRKREPMLRKTVRRTRNGEQGRIKGIYCFSSRYNGESLTKVGHSDPSFSFLSPTFPFFLSSPWFDQSASLWISYDSLSLSLRNRGSKLVPASFHRFSTRSKLYYIL